MNVVVTLALVMLASGCCSGSGADGSCTSGEDDAAVAPDARIDAAAPLPDAAATASCSTTPPPDGGVTIAGGVVVFPARCGQDPTCRAPVCWFCPGGGSWTLAGNEQCAPRDAGSDAP